MFNAGRRGKRTKDGAGIISVGTHFNQQEFLIPTITGYSVAGDSDYEADDLALDTAGGQTITINGSGFKSGAQVRLDNSVIGSVSVTPTTISFTAPAKTAGTYTLYVTNPNGGTAVLTPGVLYSGDPTWVSPAAGAELGPYYETTSYLDSFEATNPQDSNSSIVYSLYDGNFPTGATLDSNAGTLSGTAPVDGGSTTYSFTIKATDSDLQDTLRSFTLTVNTDVVTWSAPDTSQSLSVNTAMTPLTLSASSAAGYGVSYAADSLPTGLTLTNDSISGTPTVVGSQYTTLTATAATTSRTATRTITWTVELGKDTYFKNVIALLQADVSTYIGDASSNQTAVTEYGDVVLTSRSPYKENYYSMYYGGVTDYTRVEDTVNYADRDLGTGDFTVETWFYIDGRTAAQVFIDYRPTSTNGDYLLLGLDPNAGDGVYIYFQSARQLVTGANTITTDKWYHVAVVRESGVFTIYLNGIATGGTLSDSTNFVCPANRPAFGTSGFNASSVEFLGYLKDTRIVKGSAVYTENFTPPTAPLTTTSQGVTASQVSLLTNQSNTFVDNSPNAWDMSNNGTEATVSEFIPFEMPTRFADLGSAYLDGSDAYFRADDALLDIGIADEFTIECWVFAFDRTEYLFGVNTKASGENEYLIPVGTSGLNLKGTAQGQVLSTPTAPLAGGWWHVAWVYSYTGSQWNTNIYINGESAYELANVQYDVPLSDCVFGIGTEFDAANGGNPGNYMTGYVADVRVTKQALYTSSFTPSTTSLTTTSQGATSSEVKLLTLQTNNPTDNKTFVDKSGLLHAITTNGATHQGSFTPHSPFGYSAYFDGSGDYFSAPSNAAYNLGSGDFTIEAWINIRAIPGSGVYPGIVSSRTSFTSQHAWTLYLNQSTGNITFTASSTGGSPNLVITLLSNPSVHTWYHVAVCRSGNTVYTSVNGVVDAGTAYSSTIHSSTSTLNIGRLESTNANSPFNGYISNVRIIKGTALYTSNFTPSTTALTPTDETTLLTCQSPSFIDNSKTRATLTRYGDVRVTPYTPFAGHTITPDTHSNYFDGTGDYLSTPDNESFDFGSGNFTVEAWVNLQSLSTAHSPIIAKWNAASGNSNTAWWFYVASDGDIAFDFRDSNGSTYYLFSSTAGGHVTLNTWHHIAASRDGNTWRLFVDGTIVHTQTITNTINNSVSDVRIGNSTFSSNVHSAHGYISNARVVKGTALYTSDFTPSTSPLTTTSQGATASEVSLLTCQSSTLVDNSLNARTITSYGNTQPAEFNPFGFTTTTGVEYDPAVHGGSAYFDGTGDYLDVGNPVNFYDRDFTVECWIMSSRIDGGEDGIITLYEYATNKRSWYLAMDNSALEIRWSTSGSDVSVVTSASGVFNANQWHHVALVRNGSSLVGYVDGINVVSGSISGSLYANLTDPIKIGQVGTSASGQFSGYISNVRIVKGTALYTSNFVPPKRVTSVAGEALNLPFNDAAIYDAKAITIYQPNSLKVSAGATKFHNQSIDFTSGNDYIISTDTFGEFYKLGTNDYTIEFWWNFASTSGRQDLLWIGSTSTRLGILWNLNAGKLTYYPATDAISATVSFTTDTWYHIALARASGSTKMFVDGTQVGTTYTDSKNFDGTILYLGKDSGANSSYANGYMDGLRITKGTARYTSNFTAPTEAFLKK